MQDRKKDTDVYNGLLDSEGEGEGMSGNFLSCSKGVKDPLEVPEARCH